MLCITYLVPTYLYYYVGTYAIIYTVPKVPVIVQFMKKKV